ncbi:predicted protein [Nematostella vectensis]|uniref:Uncharacterized protein n=1 Tax=Nematostella vectensis TaxID=45351 RepID=A7SR20_NEMVE|nr:predicted protein [Nematostella vectensis]|eukprot:XP_001625941.1 predicted protein [Nematostella vectensis]
MVYAFVCQSVKQHESKVIKFRSYRLPGVKEFGLSDHRMVYAFVCQSVKQHESKVIQFRSYKNLDISELKKDIEEIDFPLTHTGTVDQLYTDWKERVTSVLESKLPTKKMRLLEITKLRPLQDLTEISMVGNPMSTLAHSHLYAIFQLRSLTTLDKQTVMDDERVAADDRFGQDEIRRLEAELNRQNKLYDALFEEKHSVSTELDKVSRLHQQQKEKDTQLAQRNKELQRELNAKEEILASKTKELSRACEKQFRLEQELAFYKLDAKFEHLGKLPWPEGAEFPEVEDDEAAYIGKAGYKPNAFARESHPLSPSQKAELSAIGARLSDRYGGQNKNTLDELHEALLSDLQDQEMAVKKAQLELAKLEDELRRKRNQLKDAVDELDQVQRAIEEEIQLLDDEDRRLMAAIAEKKKFHIDHHSLSPTSVDTVTPLHGFAVTVRRPGVSPCRIRIAKSGFFDSRLPVSKACKHGLVVLAIPGFYPPIDITIFTDVPLNPGLVAAARINKNLDDNNLLVVGHVNDPSAVHLHNRNNTSSTVHYTREHLRDLRSRGSLENRDVFSNSQRSWNI